MKVINQNKGSVISEDAGIAYSFLSRLRGLMLSKKRDLVLVSPKEDIAHSSIHMLFMKFPIDVIWLNSEMRVVDIRKKIPPFNISQSKTWKIYRSRKPARYVVELGVGKLGTTEIGNEIEFLW